MTCTENEVFSPEVFQFSTTRQEVRSLLIETQPWLIAKDVCEVLGLSDTEVSVRKLDEDEKLTRKIYGSGQNRKMWLINESGFYALVMKSTKPEAKLFRKWVTSVVLPSIRKKGYFGTVKRESDFIDARDVPYIRKKLNGFLVRSIFTEGTEWYSLNDIHAAIGSRTGSVQSSRKLNQRQTLARKIWIFGNTHPSWFTTLVGFELLMSASRLLPVTSQLSLEFEVDIYKKM